MSFLQSYQDLFLEKLDKFAGFITGPIDEPSRDDIIYEEDNDEEYYQEDIEEGEEDEDEEEEDDDDDEEEEDEEEEGKVDSDIIPKPSKKGFIYIKWTK